MFVSMVDSLILLFLELKFLVVVWQLEMKSRNVKDRNHMPDSKEKIHELKIFRSHYGADEQTKLAHRLVKKNLNLPHITLFYLYKSSVKSPNERQWIYQMLLN